MAMRILDIMNSLFISSSLKAHIRPLIDESGLKLHFPIYSPPEVTTRTISPASGSSETDLIAPENIQGCLRSRDFSLSGFKERVSTVSFSRPIDEALLQKLFLSQGLSLHRFSNQDFRPILDNRSWN
jgi:hypothetical protein